LPSEFRVDLPGPLDIPASVERFRRWGDDLIDRWDGQAMVRVLHLADGPVAFAACSTGSVQRPRLEVQIEDAACEAEAADAIRAMFVSADLAALIASDPAIAAANARFPGLRPVLERDPLTALVRSISAQQINLAFATVVRRRLVQSFGRRHVVGAYEAWSYDAQRLASASVQAIRDLQFTARKAEYIIAVAQRIAASPLHFQELQALPDEQVIERLTALPGIGRWSAEWYLARTLGRPVVSAGDLGVRKAVGIAYFDGRLPSETEVRAATAHWGAAAGVAQQLLLEMLYTRPRRPSPI
jgi:DNA-3-methyladenine glycosylase II